MIGWIMNESPQGVPAQRVINSKGELSGSWAFGSPGLMRQLLEAEGIVFSAEERVDLKRYGWDPTRDLNENELKCILDDAAHNSVNVSERLLFLMRTDPVVIDTEPRTVPTRIFEQRQQSSNNIQECLNLEFNDV